jgi:GntR family transcriptional regulator
VAKDGEEMLSQLDNTPLAERARETILSAILNHRFEDDRLPAEDELGKMLNVSRTTIRTALHSLEQDGIITRRRAVGTTVNRHVGPATLGLQRLVGFDWLLEEKGYKSRIDVSWRRGPIPDELAAVFRIEPGEDCYLTEKRFYADDELAIYDRDIVPWRNLRADVTEDSPAVLFAFSQANMKAPIDHAVVEVVPLVMRKGMSTKLNLSSGTPFCRLHERHYSSAGEAIAFSVIDVDDSYIRFEVFRREPR